MVTTQSVTAVFADMARAISAQHAAQLSADKLFAQSSLSFDAIKAQLVALEKTLTSTGIKFIEQYKAATQQDATELTKALHAIIASSVQDFIKAIKN